MTSENGLTHNNSAAQIPDSLKTLVEFLELSLDAGASVLMMRHTNDVCTIYIGDPSSPEDELKPRGAIAVQMANEILDLTHAGYNRIDVGEETYRFVRSFTQMGDSATVVFSTT